MTRHRQQLRIHSLDDLRLDTVPLPNVGAGDVLVRVAVCGICGSDLGYLAKGGTRGPTGTPMPLGHEFSGVIDEVGAHVADLCPGMRVVVNPDDDGIGNGGPEGGFSEWVLVKNARLGGNIHPLPDALSFERAALVEPLSVSLHGVNRARVKPESKVVVYGAGVIGLGVVVGLRRRGVRDIVVVDLQDARLETARRLGASATVNPAREDLQAALGRLHGTRQKYGFASVATDVFIDAAGAGGLLQQTVAMCASGARIVVVAVYRQPVALDLVMVMAKEIELAGSIAYPGDEFQEVIGMLAQGEVDVDPLITHRFTFSAALAAFEQARDATRALKVMVEIDTEEAP
ncbi:zinc-dependent alcohol dehydrogenase [Denitratisoma sp. DHT3]|uniref:zinc-dependent alcohol dehydrogenase n=1 Tax=Denitratisoma sp. DHT3 TaxID=1981880 RepID=UPI001647A0E0|nr:zinc-binding dehydrogenase [Denitratisoma sp. DHT3]